MKKYKVIYNKWAYVEAEDESDALDKAARGSVSYGEEAPVCVEEVEEYEVEW